MQERLCGAICLGPTGNFQGTSQFICLKTGERITRQKFNGFPEPDSVVKRVEELAKTESNAGDLTFIDIHRNEITDDAEYNKIYINEVHGSNTYGNSAAVLVQQGNVLPVTDTDNPPVIILEDNEDSNNGIVHILTTPPFPPRQSSLRMIIKRTTVTSQECMMTT